LHDKHVFAGLVFETRPFITSPKLVWKRKRENIIASRNCEVLLTSNSIGHGRGVWTLPHVKSRSASRRENELREICRRCRLAAKVAPGMAAPAATTPEILIVIAA
jgi:hypothetical protein